MIRYHEHPRQNPTTPESEAENEGGESFGTKKRICVSEEQHMLLGMKQKEVHQERIEMARHSTLPTF